MGEKEPLAVRHSIQIAEMEQRLKTLEKIILDLVLEIPINKLTDEQAKMITERKKPCLG